MPIAWLLLAGAIGLARADEPSLFELMFGNPELPLAEVRKSFPIVPPGDAARAYAEGLGLELEGADTVSGVYLPGTGGEPVHRLRDAPVVKFGGVRLRMTGLSIDRLTFASAEEALVFAHRVKQDGGAVIEVRGKGLVILTGPGIGDAELVGHALRDAWNGSRFTDAPRTLLSLERPDGSRAEIASSRGTRASDQVLLRQLDDDAARLAVYQPGSSGDWTVVWADGLHEQALLSQPDEVRLYYRTPRHVVSSRADDLGALLGARSLLQKLVEAAPRDMELPPGPIAAPTPESIDQLAKKNGIIQALGGRPQEKR